MSKVGRFINLIMVGALRVPKITNEKIRKTRLSYALFRKYCIISTLLREPKISQYKNVSLQENNDESPKTLQSR
jgi:hypothetical protein